jgi:zinc protease
MGNPEKNARAVELLVKGMNDCAQNVDPVVLQKVKDYMLKQADIDAKQNNYWINTITTFKEYGLDVFTDYKKTVEALTVDNVRDFLNELLKSGNHVEVIMTPETK